MTGGTAPVVEVKGPEDFSRIFEVSRETLEKLRIYEEILCKWQQKINLVAPSTLDTLWHRHFADSAQLLRYVPRSGGHWIDLGSGAGFPGLVLALMRPAAGAKTTLIEADTRKCAFLREVARETSALVDIQSCRIELSTTQSKVARGDLVTARALAPLCKLLGLADPFFGPSTVGLFAKGRGAAGEIEGAVGAWSFEYQLHQSLTDAQGQIVEVRDLRSKA